MGVARENQNLLVRSPLIVDWIDGRELKRRVGGVVIALTGSAGLQFKSSDFKRET